MNELASHSSDEAVEFAGGYVPVIDIGPYFTGDEREKQKLAGKIGAACREIGFYIIVGHGISPKLLDGLDRVSVDDRHSHLRPGHMDAVRAPPEYSSEA